MEMNFLHVYNTLKQLGADKLGCPLESSGKHIKVLMAGIPPTPILH